MFALVAGGFYLWRGASPGGEQRPQEKSARKPSTPPQVSSGAQATISATHNPTNRLASGALTNARRIASRTNLNAPAPVLGGSPNSGTNSPNDDVFPRPVRDVAEAQIALARLGISSGSVDGRFGPQTRMAIMAFQKVHQLQETGQLDPPTRAALVLSRPAFGHYTLTEQDLNRLQPLSKTWSGKAQQTALDYETVLELVAERARTHPQFLRSLNPPGVFDAPRAGARIVIPDTELDEITPCDFIRIFLSRRMLEAYDSETNLVAHFPCSIAQRVEKRPAGELHVTAIAPNPNYTFDPDLFPESPEAQEHSGKLVLPPGPNNPVGVAWIGLDRPGYGIHGTPSPEQVGRTESHGCFRLANWNAEHLLKIIQLGTPVYVEP